MEKEEKIFVSELLGEKTEEEKKEKTEEKQEEQKKDEYSEIFEKLAEIRGISKEEMKNEILWALEKAETEKAVREILEGNPGMNRETAKELAKFRKEAKKPKEEKKEDKSREKLSELDEFIERHSEEALLTLANSVVEDWEGGIPLETAFEKYRALEEKKELFEELQKLREEKTKEEQKKYARQTDFRKRKSEALNRIFTEIIPRKKRKAAKALLPFFCVFGKKRVLFGFQKVRRIFLSENRLKPEQNFIILPGCPGKKGAEITTEARL